MISSVDLKKVLFDVIFFKIGLFVFERSKSIFTLLTIFFIGTTSRWLSQGHGFCFGELAMPLVLLSMSDMEWLVFLLFKYSFTLHVRSIACVHTCVKNDIN